MKAVDRVLARDGGCLSPGGPRFGPGVADELQHQPIVVLEGNHLPRRPLKRDSVTHQPLDPESQCARQDGERRDGDLACPLAPGSRAGPREEGHDASRIADLVAEVEMVGLRIVEIHGALHQPEAEQPHVEIDRKSTRLNSSHLVISYAVFCLKKKKKKQKRDTKYKEKASEYDKQLATTRRRE